MINLNNKDIKPTMFPDNTSQIWCINERYIKTDNNIITWKFENEGEYIHLAQLVDLLDSYDVKYSLSLPYLPYGRQDKNITNVTTFALRTFAKLINILKFTKVVIKDAHSQIALSLINNAEDYFMTKTLQNLKNQYDSICLPDKGAKDKYSKYFLNEDIITGHKTRDQLTGYITDYKFEGNPNCKNILIVDDICDGGMTFRISSERFIKNKVLNVWIYI